MKVENAEGAGGIIGTNHVMKAPPDGYTLFAQSGITASTRSNRLFLGDETFGLRPALLRIALMVGMDDPDLGAAQTRETRALARKHICRTADIERNNYRDGPRRIGLRFCDPRPAGSAAARAANCRN